jgi:hypothetical protein
MERSDRVSSSEIVSVLNVSSVGGSVSALAAGAEKSKRPDAMKVEMKCHIERRMGDAWKYWAIREDWCWVAGLLDVFMVA